MTAEIIVPQLGESVTEATIAKWYKKPGDSVKAGELVLELETDKVNMEVTAPANGVISEIKRNAGDVVKIGEVLGYVAEGKVQQPQAAPAATVNKVAQEEKKAAATSEAILSPAAKKLATESNIKAEVIQGSGKDGRVTKGDVLEVMQAPKTAPASASFGEKPVERVKMTRLRKRIAERLKESQNTAAMLTTFNEVDMSNVMAARNKYKDIFEKKHGVKLGFMSFFVKAAIVALKELPAVNAEIEGDDIIYKNFYDIGVAVGTEQGLVVPIVRNADQISFAAIEKTIAGLGKKARDGKLTLEDLSGGTFTISNGGIYGSLLSTPIINPPQSAILGMHKIQEKPVAIDGKIEIRPMMYLALSYDHRIIDGREAVTFLVRIKECIESPERLILDI